MINFVLGQIGIKGPIWASDPFWAQIAVVVVDIWEWTPFFILVFVAGLYSLPTEFVEAADVDGLTRWMKFRCIIIPFLKPLILFSILIRLIDAFKMYDIIYVITYGGPGSVTEILSFRIWKEAFSFRNIAYACAMSLILLLVVIIISNFLMRALRRK